MPKQESSQTGANQHHGSNRSNPGGSSDNKLNKRITAEKGNQSAMCQLGMHLEDRFVSGGPTPFFTFCSQSSTNRKATNMQLVTQLELQAACEDMRVESRMAVANNTIDVSPDALGSVVQTYTGKPPIELEHAKRPRQYALDMCEALPVRFQGGGTEQLQCFICLAYKRAYVPKQLSEEYVSHCYTCGRGACDNHGSWEVGHVHCALCHATDDGFLAEVKDTFAVRCLSKTFQNQRLLHTNEEAFNDLMLTLCTGGINRSRGMGNYDEQGLKVQPQEASDVELPWDDAQQLVAAILLSRLGTAEDAAKVLGQSWVPTWDGWKELQTSRTEAHCVAVADRLCDIAQVNAPGRSNFLNP